VACICITASAGLWLLSNIEATWVSNCSSLEDLLNVDEPGETPAAVLGSTSSLLCLHYLTFSACFVRHAATSHAKQVPNCYLHADQAHCQPNPVSRTSFHKVQLAFARGLVKPMSISPYEYTHRQQWVVAFLKVQIHNCSWQMRHASHIQAKAAVSNTRD